MNGRSRRNQQGFTLIEVMFALLILGSGLFVLLEAHYNALHRHVELRDEVLLRRLTQQALGLAEVQVLAGTLEESGDFGPRYPEYTYSFEAAEAGSEDHIGLMEVQVRVAGPAGERAMTALIFGTETTWNETDSQ